MGGQPKCNFDSEVCQLCNDRLYDTPVHILFVCTSLHDIRNSLNLLLLQSMPCHMIQSFTNLSNVERFKFLLSGTSKDLYSVMRCTANYVFGIYKKRKELYDVE